MKHLAEQYHFSGMPVPQSPEEERSHHEYGPSVLNALRSCPGYRSRGGTNQAAEDGDRLHDEMQKVCKAVVLLNGRCLLNARAVLAKLIECGNIVVGEEEHLYLEKCCDELDFWLTRGVKDILTEGRVHVYNPDGSELNYGHFDVLLVMSDESAVLLDWKFGWIAVPHADDNEQGKCYALGNFQKFPKLAKIIVIFVQPKLHTVTRKLYVRQDVPKLYRNVRTIIEDARDNDKTLRPNPYCDFCKNADGCTALLNPAAQAVAIHEGLPMPKTFEGLQINTPEEAARALYVLDRLEVLIERSGLKEKARQLARENGGQISCEIAPGQRVVIELRTKKPSRHANSPALIADVLKDILTPEQVLGACEPKITRLEEIFAEVLTTKGKAEADEIMQRGQLAADACPDRKTARAILDAAKAEAKDSRVSRKKAVEILNDTLLSENLITSPEGRVEFLKTRLEKTQKQLS